MSRNSGIFVKSNGFLKYLNLEGWKFQWYSGRGVSAADGVLCSSLSDTEGNRVGSGDGVGEDGIASVCAALGCLLVLDGQRPRVLKCCSFQRKWKNSTNIIYMVWFAVSNSTNLFKSCGYILIPVMIVTVKVIYFSIFTTK